MPDHEQAHGFECLQTRIHRIPSHTSMDVDIDQPWRYQKARGVNHGDVGGLMDKIVISGSHCQYFAIFNDDIMVIQNFDGSENSGVDDFCFHCV